MNKNLPKVFANPIDKELRNNKDVFYGDSKTVREVINVNVPKKINEIFASVHHVYKSRVQIITNNEEFEAVIVGKTGNQLLTLDGNKIDINGIVDINRI